jgi:hypothetical protein
MRIQTPNKKVRNATTLEYEGITFKSKLELYCYKQLQQLALVLPIDFSYDSIKFNLLDPFLFTNDCYELVKRKNYKQFEQIKSIVKGMTYTPDFVITHTDTKEVFIIETKGNPNDAFPIRWKLFKKFLSDNKIQASVYMPRNQKHIDQVINIIKTKYNA